MRRSFFPLLVVFVVVVAAVGFYRGWFTVSSRSPLPGSHNANVNLTMDGDKMEQDAATVKKKTNDLIDNVTDKVTEPSEKGAGDR